MKRLDKKSSVTLCWTQAHMLFAQIQSFFFLCDQRNIGFYRFSQNSNLHGWSFLIWLSYQTVFCKSYYLFFLSFSISLSFFPYFRHTHFAFLSCPEMSINGGFLLLFRSPFLTLFLFFFPPTSHFLYHAIKFLSLPAKFLFWYLRRQCYFSLSISLPLFQYYFTLLSWRPSKGHRERPSSSLSFDNRP